MPDNHSKEIRSFNMSRIRAVNNSCEEIVRKYLFARGLRYRKNDKRYPGKPDIVLPKYKVMVFINGCFWHMHDGCKQSVLPQNNADYWIPKLQANRERDGANRRYLEQSGWRVITVWECELKKDISQQTLRQLYEKITLFSGEK
jgi:DNA mismatch endonuclease (patch repair protein)